MNARHAKSIRRGVRAQGLHPRAVKLKEAKPLFIQAFPVTAGPGCYFHRRELVPNCGRAVYRNLKKAVRNGLIPAIF